MVFEKRLPVVVIAITKCKGDVKKTIKKFGNSLRRVLQNASIFYISIGLRIWHFKCREKHSGKKSDLKIII